MMTEEDLEAWRAREEFSMSPIEMSRVLRACSGLSLPSNVPVGALREVVEALRAMLPEWAEEAMDESLTAYKPFCELTTQDVRRALKALSQLSESPAKGVSEKGEPKE